MKRASVLVTITLMATLLLSGCVIVPFGGWHGGGHYRSYPDRPYNHRGW
jgi:hypothetical protein